MEELLRKLKEILKNTKTYLVGGFVRDYLLKRKNYDIDLIADKNPKELAQKLAEELKGTYFGFEKENLPLREKVYTVIAPFKGRKIRIDLSQFKDLKEDLAERDFTINALAIPLKNFVQGNFKVIDYFGGLKDLKKGLIRAVKSENLLKDPLRMLRAYRFVQQLNFKIEPATREFIKKHKEKLKDVAPERVAVELFKAVKYPNSYKFFEQIYSDSVLKTLFGKLSEENFNRFLDLLKEIEKNISKFSFLKRRKSYLGEFDEEAALKWIAFFTIVPVEEELVNKYPFGKDFEKCVSLTKEGLKSLKNLNLQSVADIYRYLKGFEKCIYPIAVIGYVENPLKVQKLVDFYLKRFIPNRKPLLDGREIMQLLKLKPSPLIGQLLEELVLKQLEGKVKNKEEAEEFLKNLYKKMER